MRRRAERIGRSAGLTILTPGEGRPGPSQMLSQPGSRTIAAFKEAIYFMRSGDPRGVGLIVRTCRIDSAGPEYGPDDVQWVGYRLEVSQDCSPREPKDHPVDDRHLYKATPGLRGTLACRSPYMG